MMNRNIEILAPAGDFERLRAALDYGAHAVYLAGNEFGMRAGATNFSNEELPMAVELAHSKGVKVYVTCNTIPRCDELDRLRDFLQFAAVCKIDALIIGDLGVFEMARRYAPNIPIHMSTQTGIANYETANVLHKMGASRVVLARELSCKEIEQIRKNTSEELEIEVFVHGSMCVSFSGRCLISNYLTNRDANRGECAQPCRWGYHLMEETRPGEYFPIFEDEKGTHILNSRDICLINRIPELVNCGVTSFKIEGRAKSSYYTAVVTNAYRCAVEEYLKNPSDDFVVPGWIADEVCKVSHREYSEGFFTGGHPGQAIWSGGYIREYEVAAIVEGYENGNLVISQRNKFLKGQVLEAIAPGIEPVSITVDEMFDSNGQPIESAPNPMMTVLIPTDKELCKGAILRRAK